MRSVEDATLQLLKDNYKENVNQYDLFASFAVFSTDISLFAKN